MAITNLNTIKNWFKTGLEPTQAQFWAWMDSFWHKDEMIPTNKIEGLEDVLNGKATTQQLDNKVDKVPGKSLLLDSEIERLSTLGNQDLSMKADLVDGKVPASQLPGYIDDVLDGTFVSITVFNDLDGIAYQPEAGKIYIDTTTNITYRWSGTVFAPIGSNVALGETPATAYRGDRGKIAYDKAVELINSGMEFLSNSVLKLKVMWFGGFTISQRNAISSPQEGMLIYINESPKGFQKYENGAWTLIGSNISNTDLTNLAARTFTQNASFTWNTLGNFYYWKGLVDKTGNATYTKALIVHPTTGEVVTRDFADPANTALAVQNATTAQKTAMRVALLGSAVPASPAVNLVNTWYIRRGIDKMLFLSGVNLTPLDPVAIWIENGATKIFALNYFSISSSALQTFWNIPLDFPLGDYPIKLTFGAVVQGASPGLLRVLENSTSLVYNFTTADFKVGLRAGGTITGATPTAILGNNIFRIAKRSTTYATIDDSLDSAIKTSNIFQGALAASWEIILSITAVNYNTASANNHIGMVLTETSDAGFNTVESLVFNHVLLLGAQRQGYANPEGGIAYNVTAAGFTNSVVVRKTGNKVATYGFNPTTGLVTAYSEIIIDTSKTFALAIIEANTFNFNFIKEVQISATILNP